MAAARQPIGARLLDDPGPAFLAQLRASPGNGDRLEAGGGQRGDERVVDEVRR